MADLYSCPNCGAKFAKLVKLKCNVCNLYKCPSCSSCYCDYGKKQEKKSNFESKIFKAIINSQDKSPLLVTIEYARYLVRKSNLQLKGHIEFIGQRHITTKDKREFLISDFLFYDRNDNIPLRIFGPVPQNLFKYRFAINKVLLKGVKIRIYKGEFELLLESHGEIILLKEKSNQSLLKYLNNKISNSSELLTGKVEI